MASMGEETAATEAAPAVAPDTSPGESVLGAIKESASEHADNPEGAFVRDGDRDVFDRILSSRDESADPGDAAPEAEEKKEEVASKEGKAPKEETKEQESEEAPVLSEATLRALRRAQTPQEVIDSMTPEQADTWAAKLKEVQDETDKAFSRVKELERQLEEEAESDDGTSELEDSESSTDFEPVTLAPEDVTPLIERLGLDDDPDAAAELYEAFNVVAAAVDKVHQTRMKPQQDPRVEQLEGTIRAMALRMAREDLGRRYPEVKEDESKFMKVIDKFQTLYATGDYQSEDDAMADAALLTLGRSNGSEASKPKETGKPSREDQPTVDTSKAPERDLSPGDKDREVFDQILAKRRGRAAV